MSRAPVRIRTFILGTVLVLLLAPALAGAAAWVIERDHQQATVQQRLNTARAYLTSHRIEVKDPASVQGFARLLNRLDMLAQVVVVSSSPPGKSQLYLSPALNLGPPPEKQQAGKAGNAKARLARATPANAPAATTASWTDTRHVIVTGTPKSRATLVVDLYHRPASRSARAVAALVTGLLVLLLGLAVTLWLARRWMVAPLARLSTEVDKVAGGDLTIAVPRSRIGEIANIAQAVEGMAGALGETAQRRAEADEARGFLVTSVAHDLRTPLFALRGHLQAIGSQLGDPTVHLERAEARADALERLIGNLFAYVRDDYAQPVPRLEAAPFAEMVREVTAGLEHAARLRDNAFVLDGDQALTVMVDRDRLKRALTNILDNAVRYSPPGAPIQLSWAAVDESSVEIVARDHGPGIDPNLLPHIFEPGIRGAPAAGDLDGGSGLGLTIAKRLLEHQHATLTIDNDATGGAIVRLVLQRAPTDD
jgi:signal transduction histidine kinase